MVSSPKLQDGTFEVRLRHQGRDRSYLLRIGGEEEGIPKPLLLALHGRGIEPFWFDRWTGYSALADEEGFVLAMPSAVSEIWNDGRYGSPFWKELEAIDDVGYLHAVIDDVIGRQGVLPGGRRRTHMARCEHLDATPPWSSDPRARCDTDQLGLSQQPSAAPHMRRLVQSWLGEHLG